MTYSERRQEVLNRMAEHSLLILFSGVERHISADEYALFEAEANRNFFYLTGLRRENMILVLEKASDKPKATLFIEEADPTNVRWYGKKVSKEEAKEVSGIESISYLDSFEAFLDRTMTKLDVENLYFDTYRHQFSDLPDYNVVKAGEFASKYPGIGIKNIFPMIAEMRMQKDETEIELTKKAIELTNNALQFVMKNLEPGMREYQAQADFEYHIRRNGAEINAFPTIAGSGMNGTMLHYNTNQEVCEDGTLLLLDLGARYKGYNADITRTYPVNGKFTDKQRQVYELVLSANRHVASIAKPGMTLLELQDACKKVLAEGCIKLGLIEKEEDVVKYYMHGVSHHLGIDVHDVTVDSNKKLRPGAIITDEPGLYIDEWAIGIRIEDDLLITEDGCVCLSEDIIRNPDDIEKFMAK